MQYVLGVFFAASLSLLASCQDTDLTTVLSVFKNASIPEDTNMDFEPKVLFQVIYPQNSGAPVNVTAGVQLPRNQTTIPPLFGVIQSSSSSPPSDSDIGDTFVVAFVDLDALTPQNRSLAQIRHFLGGNFLLGKPDAAGLIILTNSTPAVSDYLQLRPPAGSDPHRYVFLLFRQPDDFNNQTELNATTSISKFNTSKLALDVGLGDPLGGTFILVGPDPPSPTPVESESSAALCIVSRLSLAVVGMVVLLCAS